MAHVVEEDGCFAVVASDGGLFVSESLHGRDVTPLTLRVADSELTTARQCIARRRVVHDQTYHVEEER